MVGNKNDLFDQEQVNSEEGKKFAEENGAIFKITSAFTGIGIEQLFKSIGAKVLDPNYKDIIEEKIENNQFNSEFSKTIKLDSNKLKEDNDSKKICCNYY